jgi:hypothetical protein
MRFSCRCIKGRGILSGYFRDLEIYVVRSVSLLNCKMTRRRVELGEIIKELRKIK